MTWTLRPSRPPWSLTIFCQTWYPWRAALPGSEKSPVSGSDAPMRIGLLDEVFPPPPPPPLSLPPHAATSSAVAASAGAHHRSLLIHLLLSPLQTFAAIDCDRSSRGAGLSRRNPLSPWRGGRAAGHEGGRQTDLRGGRVPVGEPLEQQVGGGRPDLAMWDSNRRQRRVEAVGERHVVEADDRHVLRAVQPALGEHVVAAEGEQVVGRDDRRDVGRGVEQLAADARALLLGERVAEADRVVAVEAGRGHRREEAEVALVAG